MISNQLKHLSLEQKLALKITTISFVIFILLIGTIIASSFLYLRNGIIHDFERETQSITEMGFLRNIFGNMIDNPLLNKPKFEGRGGPKTPRDVVIFDKSGSILKNDFLTLTEDDTKNILAIPEGQTISLSIDEKEQLIFRMNAREYDIFLTRDIHSLYEFHEKLILMSIGISLIGIIFLYFLALYFAKLSITPIREHNASLESYNRNVAHELRTPLAIMQSNLELIELTGEKKLIESSKEEISSMERIIETLLFLSSPHKTSLEKEKIDIKKLTKEVIETYHDSDIHFNAGKGNINLIAHEELWKRVLTNLIDNAKKYKSEGNIEVHLTPKSLTISNIVDHTLENHTLEKLTEAFYQADISRHSSGHGLGLALVKKIVETSGWTMEIQCEDHRFSVHIFFG